MELPGDLHRTPLHETHRGLGARMVAFAGWELPVQYSGVIAEHLAVRSRAGLFDVSHMGELEVRGSRAARTLQRLTCNDVSGLAPGQAQYSALLTPAGGILDDLILYRREPENFLLIVNAHNTTADHAWVRDQSDAGVEVGDRSAEFALLALQGPLAREILEPVTDVDLSSLGPFRWAQGRVAGVPTMVARTGYTGEDGYELMMEGRRAVEPWNALMEEGRPKGLLPVGLAARDTLRLEAGLLLHGNDMTVETTPLEAGLGFIVKWDAGDFLGREVLVRQRAEGVTRRQTGLEMIDPGIARRGHQVWAGGELLGEVTSGSFAPFVRKNIARAYLPAGRDRLGSEVEVEVRNRRLRARVVKTPFYRRSRR